MHQMEVEQSHSGNGEGDRYEKYDRSNGFNFGNGGDEVEGNGGWSKGSASAKTPTPTTSAFDFSFPPKQSTPDRRRQAPPTSIPNFPSSHEPRNPPPTVPFSPSPTQSPMASSPFRSPDPPLTASSSRTPGFNLPMSLPFATPSGSGAHSPWHSLAATSGAPTPSLEGGPMAKGSPHLGYPFERLNIGGSWSGANLWGEGAQGRRDSADSTGGGLGSSPGKAAPMQLSSPPPMVLPPTRPARGLSAETLSRYKAMASSGSNPASSAMAKVASQGEIRAHSNDSSAPSQLPPALARRRGSLPKTGNNPPSLSLPPSRAGKSPSPLASTSTLSSPGPKTGGRQLQSITVTGLLPLLSSPTTLILDVRPPSSFQNSHIPSSHSLPIPSTLLRRPAFNLEKLAQMLSPHSQEAVLKWREKSDIVLIDADSSSVSAGSVLDGLSSKFEREGFAGHLWFVNGGHSALVSHGQVKLDAQDGDDDTEAGQSSSQTASNAAGRKGMMAGTLGSLAFKQESTGGRSGRAPPPMGLSIPPTPGFNFKSNPFGFSMPASQAPTTTVRPPSVSGSSQSGMSSPNKTKYQPANPFFDNIRQNLELSHGGITERIPLNLSKQVMSRVEDLPDFLRDLAIMPEKESMDRLAKQFYELELNEQKRLQAIMEWHSNGSGMALGDKAGKESWVDKRQLDAEEVQRLTDWNGEEAIDQDDYYPFSITAGVERGTKNRYKNIWPYDFSRVRLEQPPDQDSDYINASYVQPRGTSRRYIATQGPLDATYHDFWTLVWEQDVRVIVMITKQFEGGLIKCGTYWGDKTFGSLQLHQVSQTGGDDQAHQPTTGFDFGAAAVTPRSSSFPSGKEGNIKRVFKLSNSDYPGEPPRTITQIQCIGWPDFDVPETPETLFTLIKDVDTAVEKSNVISDRANPPPVVVHCSAGVGRTGSFIVVDAILDGLRRELRARRGSSTSSTESASGAERSASFPYLSASGTPGNIETGKSKSLDSGKAVSFLSPLPTSSPSTEPTRQTVTASPSPMTATVTAPTPPLRPLTAAALAENSTHQAEVQASEENMDIDSPAESAAEPQGPPRDEKFYRHRGSIATTISSEAGDTRRPSIASRGYSSELLAQDAESQQKSKPNDNAPMPIIRSGSRCREPSPVTEMANPVANVLEGMRVQRMSLVQSLRQYLFVHRAIIHNYLHILDEENGKDNGNKESDAKPNITSGLSPIPGGISLTKAKSSETVGSDTGNAEDESHIKRRASPTELELKELNEENSNNHNKSLTRTLGDIDSSTGSGLSKRPSFKKMRPAIDSLASPTSLSGNSLSSSSNSTSSNSGGSIPTTNSTSISLSPKKPNRLRSRSKLALDLDLDSPVSTTNSSTGSLNTPPSSNGLVGHRHKREKSMEQ